MARILGKNSITTSMLTKELNSILVIFYFLGIDKKEGKRTAW